MAARMPSPIAVRRPVVRLSSAPRRACRSFVGACTICAKPLNATMPICVVALWCSMNDAAADFAASRRSGVMSFEHMLPETSMARRSSSVGRHARDGDRPGSARTSAAIAMANSANGRWRRSVPIPAAPPAPARGSSSGGPRAGAVGGSTRTRRRGAARPRARAAAAATGTASIASPPSRCAATDRSRRTPQPD